MSILRPRRPQPSPATASLISISLVIFGLATAVAVPVSVASGAALGTPNMEAFQAPTVLAATAPRSAVRLAAEKSSPKASSGISNSTAAQDLGSQAHKSPGCKLEGSHGSFRGTFSSDGDRVEISGWNNGDRVIQKYVDDLRLCLRLHGEVVMNDDRTSVRAIGSGGWVAIETEQDTLQRLVITEGGQGLEYSWSIDGRELPFDSEARAWHDQALRVMDLYQQASELRGQESSLRGRISSHKGHVSSLKGQISSHKGQVSSLRGQASSYRGRVSSLKGKIASQRGHVSSLKGRIASHRGQISSLRSAGRSSSDTETQSRLQREVGEHEERILQIEREIEDYDLSSRTAEVEREIATYDVDGKSAEIERQIADYNLEGKVAEIKQQIEDYDLDQKIQQVERKIEVLDAPRRAAEIERRAEPELSELRRVIRSL